LDTIVRGTILQYNIINSVIVSGGDEISFKKEYGGMWYLDTYIG
jgi:hypothetical protein